MPEFTKETFSNKDQQMLRQCFAKVLEKREILSPALAAFAEELPSGRSQREIHELATRLQSDATVDDFFDLDDRTVSWCLLLSSGTHPQRMFSNLFDEALREDAGQSGWNRAFFYPAFVVLLSLGVLLFLCVTLVPSFKSIFDDFELSLPAMTVGLIVISNTMLRNPVGFVLGVAAASGVLYFLSHLLRIWGLPGRLGGMLTTGNSWQVTSVARFARQLAEGLDAGLSLPGALRLAGGTERQSTLRRVALQLADDAERKDFDFSTSPMARRLPATVRHALQAGSGNRPNIALLRQLAKIYTTRVRDRLNWSTGFMAQFAIVGAGLTVGFVVLALFMPLANLISGLTG